MRFLAMLFIGLVAAQPAVSQVDNAPIVAAVQASAAKDWETATVLATTAGPLAADLVQYLHLRAGADDFAAYPAFTARRGDWPGIERVYARGEEIMPKGLPAADVIAWFGDRLPETGEGAVRLAEAMMTSGQPDKARDMLAEIWLTYRLSQSGHDAMMASFADVLAPLHVARTDALLWQWRSAEVDRMLPLLEPGHAALARARLAYIRKTAGIDAAVAAVPAELSNNPGLAYDRYNWLADKGAQSEAVALLRARSTSVQALGDPFRWSGWRRSLARFEMRAGRADVAYELAANHFLTEGSSFADLEWLAGYIALTYQKDTTKALIHFARAAADVESPISEGRMDYWQARAYQTLGDANAAAAAYGRAAQHQTGFYGLLAAEELGMSLDPALTGRGDPTDWVEAPVMDKELTQAAIALLQGGERGIATTFFVALGKALDAQEISQLGAFLQEIDEPYYAVVLGKTAVTRNVLVPSVYFPLHPMMNEDLRAPMALNLSIARRESEFNAGVGSPVGALGLMQLMPATAEEVAGQMALPYSRGRLTADWRYNAQLGSKYLADLIEEFGYSPVMVAAGYNAGPSRPKQWMDERGDPRLGEMDVIDWIEHIPFRETRNYVMRVAESIPIYEARLTGVAGPVRFRELLIGVKPLLRPTARPDLQAASTTTAPATPPLRAVARPAAPSAPASAQGVRPLSRPGG